jgi:hypothetical protein
MCLSDNLVKWQTNTVSLRIFLEFEPEVKEIIRKYAVSIDRPQGAIRRLKSSSDERCSPGRNARVTGTARDTKTPVRFRR